MGLYIDRGNSGFKSALSGTIQYVDKSGLIAHLNANIDSGQRFLCITRPRRFGKTLAAQMIAAYYNRACNSRDLFANLDIARDPSYETHLNRYPVIFFDVQEQRSNVTRGDDFVAYLQEKIGFELKKLWPNETQNCHTIQEMLAQIHEHTQTKFVTILDEWHAIYRMDQDNEHAILMWIDFLRSLFKGPYANDYIALAYMTGVLPIRRFTSESPLNNFYEYTVFNTYPIGQFYGFTENEVKSLCKKYEMNYDEMKRWYDGYLYQDQYMYNPNSVVKAIAFRNIIGYWNETGAFEPIKRYIQMDIAGLRQTVTQLIAGASIHFNIVNFANMFDAPDSIDAIMTVLAHFGYISYDPSHQTGCIPNEEVRFALQYAANVSH